MGGQTSCCAQDVDAKTEAIEPDSVLSADGTVPTKSSDVKEVIDPSTDKVGDAPQESMDTPTEQVGDASEEAAAPTKDSEAPLVESAKEVVDAPTDTAGDAPKEEATSPKASEAPVDESVLKSEETVAAAQTDMPEPKPELEADSPDDKPATKAKAKAKGKSKAKAKSSKKKEDETKAEEAAPSTAEQAQPNAEGPPTSGGLSPQDEELLAAATAGDTKKIKALAKAGVKLDVKNADGMSALHLAALANQEDAVGRILLDGKKIMKKLIKAANKDKETALHIACAHDHKSIATMLVFEGADWKAKNTAGKTPVQLSKDDLSKWLSTGDPVSTRPPWLK